jgi:NAD/NADP transhydrogenase beta subunit
MVADKSMWSLSNLTPCFVCGLTVMAFVAGLDSVLLHSGLSIPRLLSVSNVVIGALASLLALQIHLEQRRKHRILEQRIEALSEVSQHVRSVFTAITFYGSQTGNPHSAQIVSRSLGRIEANLGQLFTRLLFGDAMPQSTLKKVKAMAVSLLNARPEVVEECGECRREA